ncbi:putative quinol monooxygenase [Cupriavidus pampae]|uniref:ABM domain-containing protein n=1 Tax=Cupriavidus pampae TaxID=659251 RepID=A0ABM8XS14_9BURK|nr:antibiotic biosynthesis monooxygenase family protein [Cupriavidus pampae]CAG9183077.1 hypothetical protein LMG32289_05271 [Cupriavidus pampae]
MQPIVVIATITAQPGSESIVRDALTTAVAAVRGEPGCEQYDLNADTERPGSFVMVERWSSKADLETHANAPAFVALAKTITGIAQLSIQRLTPVA